MISREVMHSDLRVGFEILELTGSKGGWFAQFDSASGARVGKYSVNLKALEDWCRVYQLSG